MKLKKKRKKKAENTENKNRRDKKRKEMGKCGVIPGSPACEKQAGNGGRHCQGCKHNK